MVIYHMVLHVLLVGNAKQNIAKTKNVPIVQNQNSVSNNMIIPKQELYVLLKRQHAINGNVPSQGKHLGKDIVIISVHFHQALVAKHMNQMRVLLIHIGKRCAKMLSINIFI